MKLTSAQMKAIRENLGNITMLSHPMVRVKDFNGMYTITDSVMDTTNGKHTTLVVAKVNGATKTAELITDNAGDIVNALIEHGTF